VFDDTYLNMELAATKDGPDPGFQEEFGHSVNDPKVPEAYSRRVR
jgi:hypothetical protein